MNVLATLTVHDHFNQSMISIELECMIKNYPPTCLEWSHNNIVPLASPNDSMILDRNNTLYSNRIIVHDEYVTPGNYTCNVNSTGAVFKQNKSHVYIEGTHNE